MLGDSITQYAWQDGGTAARLADHYQRRLDVATRGYGGYTSRNIRYTLPHVFTSATPIQLAIVWLGANDLVWRPVDEYIEDMRQIVAAFFETRPEKSNTRLTPCLMLITAPPRLGVPVEISREYSRRLVELTKELYDRYEARVGVTEVQ
jgi:lysophospholipase L1-like esterase